MRRKTWKTYSYLFGLVFGASLIFSSTAVSATFNANHIIDDSIFNNSYAMNASQINTFLNGFSGSCISTHNGFLARDVTGYSSSANTFYYGGDVSAGTVIAHAAEAYGINPQVLLVTLQKEQGLVDGSGYYGCSANAFAAAVGYGCPDSGTGHSYNNIDIATVNGKKITSVSNTCVSYVQQVGFSQQLIHAAWLLEFDEHRSEGDTSWDVQLATTKDYSGNTWDSNWNNSDDPPSCYSGYMTQGDRARSNSSTGCGGTQDNVATYYDGYATIDSTSIHMDTGSTASLYDYTPHFNGNKNFENIFDNWFLSTLMSGYQWQPTGQAAYTDSSMSTAVNTMDLSPGQRFYVVIHATNTGSVTWNKGTYGQQVNVGTDDPHDRHSAFCDSSWMGANCNRPGTTSQTTVAPGQTGTFGFWMKAPYSLGTYNEHFNLVMDGTSWMTNDPGLYWTLKVNGVNWQPAGQAAYTDNTMSTSVNTTDLLPNQRYYLVISAKNTGVTSWNKGTYGQQVNVGTDWSRDRHSAFCDSSWMGANCNRPGTTSQTTVAPGQTGTFGFWMKTPWQTGVYKEHFNLVEDGSSWALNDPGLYWTLKVNGVNWQPAGQAAYTDNTMSTPVNTLNLSPGQKFYLVISAKNTGVTSWQKGVADQQVNVGTDNPRDRHSAFCDSSWMGANCNRPGTTSQTTVAPGQTGTFGFWMDAPTTPGTYKEYFNLVMDGTSWMANDPGLYWTMKVN
jgi:hypothetical protein